MSHVRLLICRVDEGDNQVTELARVNLPPVLADAGAAPLDTLEAQVATVGQCLLGRLCELQWDAIDAQAVARYRAGQAPGSVVADGSDTLFVASRFGTLQLRRQVCAHHDGHQAAVLVGCLVQPRGLLCLPAPNTRQAPHPGTWDANARSVWASV